MSAPVLRRIEALEARQPQAQRWVWRREGETADEAKARAGFSRDDDVIVFSWASSEPNKGAAG